jgi:hypothetical protein
MILEMRRRQSQGPEERPTYPIVAGSQPNNPASVVTIPADNMLKTPHTSTARPTINNGNGNGSGNVLELPEPPSHPAPKPKNPGIPPGIPPTRLPPTHVYAPMPAMGALSIGFLSKKKTTKEEDFKGLIHGNTINARSSFFGFPLVNGPYDSP